MNGNIYILRVETQYTNTYLKWTLKLQEQDLRFGHSSYEILEQSRWPCCGTFIINFEQVSQVVLVPSIDFEQIFVGYKC